MFRFALALVCSMTLFAQADRADRSGRAAAAVPGTFIGNATQCSPNPAGSFIVTAAWLPGLGLPDDGVSLNVTPPPNLDGHWGILLSKNGPTADCSHARVDVYGPENTVATEFGYDIRNGSHCGLTGPTFQVTTTDNVVHNAQCLLGIAGTAPQDTTQWARIRHALAAFSPAIAPGSMIKSVAIILNDGTNAIGLDVLGVGASIIDNIDVNGTFLFTRP